MPQQVPKVIRADVERIVRRDFPAEQFSEVMAILNQFGVAKWEIEWDVNRVQLAVLKLSGKNIGKLSKFLAIARNDPRDVISPAEYPSYDWDKEQGKDFSADWQHQQYLKWLNAK